MNDNLLTYLDEATKKGTAKKVYPITLRFSFDHLIQGCKAEEPLECVFYITTAGKRHHIKRLSKDTLLLDSSVEANIPSGLEAQKLLDQVVASLYLKVFGYPYKVTKKIKCSLSDKDIVASIDSALKDIFNNTVERYEVAPLSFINATGIFKNAYPTTEDMIKTKIILDAKIADIENRTHNPSISAR